MNGKWQGWAATGGVLMFVVGAFKVFSGIIGLFNDEWIVRGFDAYFFIDISALAWWYIVAGAILMLAGSAVLSGKAWGRWVGVVAASIALFSELMWIPIYPFWSILLVVMYTFIIAGFVLAGSEE